MANTNDFTEELDEQIRGIRVNVSTLDTSITERLQKMKKLEAQRRDIIKSTAATLLPDLEAGNIANLQSKFRRFTSVEEIQQMTLSMEGTYRSQLAALFKELETYEADLAKVQQDLSDARSDLTTLQSAFPDLGDDPQVVRLTKAGYGTEKYRPRWYDLFGFDFTFFNDWETADALVSFYKAKDFGQLAEQCIGQSAAKSAVKTAEGTLRALRSKKATTEDLQKKLAGIPQAVLERVRSKLEAHLDSLASPPEWLADLNAITSRINALAAEQRKDQEAHTAANSNVIKLLALKKRVTRSGKREVPDQYMSALRAARGSSSSTSSSSTVHVHTNTYSGPGFFDGLMWGQMDTYFAEERGYRQGLRDAGGDSRTGHHTSSPSWQRADTSGQS